MTQPAAAECRYCLAEHDERHLCDPAKRILDALLAQGMSFDMPTIEFPEPVWDGLGLGEPGDTLLAQFVVLAAVLDVGGIARPALVFTGRDAAGKPLPRWVHMGDNQTISAAVKLVDDMATLAKRSAAEERARRAGRGGDGG